jgi:hypothetical protein
MFKYTFNKKVNVERLLKEIAGSALTIAIDHIDTLGETVALYTLTELDENQQQVLENVVAAHIETTQADVIIDKIMRVQDFGRRMMAEYGAFNVLSGMNTAQVLQVASKLQTLQLLLMSGSLYAALTELDAIETDALITQQVKDAFKQKLLDFAATL